MGAIAVVGDWRTSAPREALWAVVNDLASWADWWPAIRRAEALGGRPAEPDAALLTFDTPAPLRPLVVTLTVVARDPFRRLRIELTDGPLRGEGLIELTDDGPGASVSYDVRVRVRSLLFKPIEPVLAGATRSSGRARLARAGDDLARLAGGRLLDDDL